MNGDVTIRIAGSGDAALIHGALASLARALGAEAKMISTEQDILNNGFGENPAFEVLIAEVGRVFAGLCLTFPSFSTWRGQRGIYVQDLYVEDGFRGRQIGEILLREAARRGRSKGASYLRLSVDTDNTRAQAFYERIGLAHSRDEQIHMIKDADFDAFANQETDEP